MNRVDGGRLARLLARHEAAEAALAVAREHLHRLHAEQAVGPGNLKRDMFHAEVARTRQVVDQRETHVAQLYAELWALREQIRATAYERDARAVVKADAGLLRRARQIHAPPGYRLLKLVEFICRKDTFEDYKRHLFAAWEHEVYEALEAGRWAKYRVLQVHLLVYTVQHLSLGKVTAGLARILKNLKLLG